MLMNLMVKLEQHPYNPLTDEEPCDDDGLVLTNEAQTIRAAVVVSLPFVQEPILLL